MNADEFDVPLTFKSNLSRNYYDTVSIKIKYRRNCMNKFKFKFPKYESEENQEILLKLIREFYRQLTRNALWMTVGEANVYEAFQECLEGNALDTWLDVAQVEDEIIWQNNLAELNKRLIGDDTYTL